MKPTPTDSGVYTIERLARNRRRLDRRRQAFDRALGAMCRGATLHLEYGRTCEWWSLSNGWAVPPDVAAILINHPNVTGVGDALFSGARCQTYRYSQGENDD